MLAYNKGNYGFSFNGLGSSTPEPVAKEPAVRPQLLLARNKKPCWSYLLTTEKFPVVQINFVFPSERTGHEQQYPHLLLGAFPLVVLL